jgi:hypothetical protein
MVCCVGLNGDLPQPIMLKKDNLLSQSCVEFALIHLSMLQCGRG